MLYNSYLLIISYLCIFYRFLQLAWLYAMPNLWIFFKPMQRFPHKIGGPGNNKKGWNCSRRTKHHDLITYNH